MILSQLIRKKEYSLAMMNTPEQVGGTEEMASGMAEQNIAPINHMTERHAAEATERLMRKLYDVHQAGRRLGCSPYTVRSYWARNLLERIKVGNLSKVSERGILEFLARSKQRSIGRSHNAGLALPASMEVQRRKRAAQEAEEARKLARI
jgi:hypothetical protein